MEQKTWAGQWVTSEGYQKAMTAKAEQDSKFWERHHKRMAELDEQDRRTGAVLAWMMVVDIFVLAVIAAIF